MVFEVSMKSSHKQTIQSAFTYNYYTIIQKPNMDYSVLSVLRVRISDSDVIK